MPLKIASQLYEALRSVEAYIRECGLLIGLVELVKMRASQINGCAFCLDSHSNDARKAGEREQRPYLLNGWRESPLYMPAERAALAWTDALTLVSKTHAPDDAYEAPCPHFSNKRIVDLTIPVGQFNLWNRLAIGMRYVHDVDPALSVAMMAPELRHAETDGDIAACFAVLRQLRPPLEDAAELVGRVRRQHEEGYRLLAAWDGACVLAAAGYRPQKNLIRGRFVYIDDLVVLEKARRFGLGARLLEEVARLGCDGGCVRLTLDTALGNAPAQRFCFRDALLATGLHFGMSLD